ncbi:MAG: hypothetical protein J7L82_03275 [Staphylothermus sp.]|nr:hypothetical protein [Staphylothermus sp.]
MNTTQIIEGVIGLFLVFVLLAALYPMIDTSASDLKQTFSCSTNTYVQQYLPKLVDYVPFLFVLMLLIGIVLYIVKKKE